MQHMQPMARTNPPEVNMQMQSNPGQTKERFHQQASKQAKHGMIGQ
jgi:hypothetical protein